MEQVETMKSALVEVLRKYKVVAQDSVGQIVIHINNGGITKVCRDKWEIK